MRIGVGGLSGRNPTGPSSVPYRRRQAEQQVGQSKISRRINLHQQNLNQKENMSIIAEPYKEDKDLFPEGKIILTDGRVLDCYPLAEQKPEKIESDSLKLDRTGQYLIIGRSCGNWSLSIRL